LSVQLFLGRQVLLAHKQYVVQALHVDQKDQTCFDCYYCLCFVDDPDQYLVDDKSDVANEHKPYYLVAHQEHMVSPYHQKRPNWLDN